MDLAKEFLQLLLDEKSSELVTINIHTDTTDYPLELPLPLPLFQRFMDTLFQGFNGVAAYIDDILVTGSDEKDHLINLEAVLTKLNSCGLRLNKSKCLFMKPSVEYLGHTIDAQGLHPTQKKVKAIKEAPSPKNITELRSFLGILNYYSKFLPQMSTKLKPLYDLLHKNAKFTWGPSEDKSFKMAKEALQADSLLVHYDREKPLVLACDASPYGVGAVLSHTMPTGDEKPIAYCSRTLSAAERKYSHLDKEGLAIIFGITKFRNYIFGRKFTIEESDHQPYSVKRKEYHKWLHPEFKDGL